MNHEFCTCKSDYQCLIYLVSFEILIELGLVLEFYLICVLKSYGNFSGWNMLGRLTWNDYFAFDSHVSTWFYVYFGNPLICIPLSNVRS